MSAAPGFLKPDWPAPPSVRALITTRMGGVSRGPYASFNLGARVGDEQESVVRNRTRLGQELPAEPLWLKQVHGTNVVAAEHAACDVEADGAVAHSRGTVLTVLTADCLPVMLCDRAGTAVGIAHAGWRGLAAGVIETCVRAMDRAPQELMAYLGPAIGPTAYEVGEDVLTAFVERDSSASNAFAPLREGKYLADLYRLARQRLAKTGIMAVFGARHCTFNEKTLFYSHRRDGVTGRMASVIWIEPE